MKQNKLNRFFGFSVATLLTLSACGPQAYVPGTVTSDQEAAGTMNIPPKVDIVLGISQDGTMGNIYSGSTGIQTGIQNLVSTLESKGWDYRFVAISLSEHSDGQTFNINNKVAVSKYDGNYAALGLWQTPYPNALASAVSILPSLFTQYFTFPGLDTAHNDGREGGLRNQAKFVNRFDVQQNFIRPDALLAMITLSNSDDRSREVITGQGSVQTCYNNNPAVNGMLYGYNAEPSTTAEPYGFWKAGNNGSSCLTDAGTETYKAQPAKIDYFKTQLAAAKGGTLNLVKYYSVVAKSNYCRAGQGRVGSTYSAVTTSVGGADIDLCQYNPSEALNQVANHLTQQHIIFRKSYLKLNSQPSPNTITVKRLASTGEQVINQDPTNGWSYVSYTSDTTLYSIDGYKFMNANTWYPYQAGQVTGRYFIKLNGDAALVGGESARIEYMNNGSVISQ